MKVAVSNQELFDWTYYNGSIEPEVGTDTQTLGVPFTTFLNPSTEELLYLWRWLIQYPGEIDFVRLFCLTLARKKSIPKIHWLLGTFLVLSMSNYQAQHKTLQINTRRTPNDPGPPRVAICVALPMTDYQLPDAFWRHEEYNTSRSHMISYRNKGWKFCE